MPTAHVLQTNTIGNLADKIKLLTPPGISSIVIFCIGSDRVTGDCLGPLVGHMLKTEHNIPAFVYGSLDSPVNALNLTQTLEFVRLRHPDCFIIAVDSSLGDEIDIGQIHVLSEGIHPGAAVAKNLPKVGNIAITATVAKLGQKDIYNVRLGFVYTLAKAIANALNLSITGNASA